MNLSGRQIEAFRDALKSAFPNRNSLDELLLFRLDWNLNDIDSMSPQYSSVVLSVIRHAMARGRVPTLLDAARQMNPGNEELLSFAQGLGLSSLPDSPSALQQLLQPKSPYFDPTIFREKLSDVENRVCAVEIRGQHMGTGFLIGPNAVITNHHVVSEVIAKKEQTTDVRLRFDYKRANDGTTINSGTLYSLEQDWLVQASPPSLADLQSHAGEPSPEELDYAILSVKGSPGNATVPVIGSKQDSGPVRGWIQPRTANYTFDAAAPLFIMQHPQGWPLKLFICMQSGATVIPSGRRVRYGCNTEPGSSGSPCFNVDWELVALHHAADPLQQRLYNQGIPFSRIIEHLTLKLGANSVRTLLG